MYKESFFMNIRESDHIEDILKYSDLEKCMIYIDFDNTLVKLNKDHKDHKEHKDHIGNFKHLGCDAWFGSVFTHAITHLNNNILLAFTLTTSINDKVQNHIHLKPAEKKTIDVLDQLQAKKVPVVIVTARGFTLEERTKEQLREARISIHNECLKEHNQDGPIVLPLDYNFYCFTNKPENFQQLGFKFSYVYIKETDELFYFDRHKHVEEINIKKNSQFKSTLKEMFEKNETLKNQKKISKEGAIALIGKNHKPESHVVVYDDNVLYCEGQNKGEAIEKFLAWVNRDKKIDRPYALMVDDKKNNIQDVEVVLTQLQINFSGLHYTRVKENFDFAASCEELKNLYPYLPVKTRAAMIEIKLSENAMGFFSQNKNVNTARDERLQCANELKTSTPMP
jgi:hypothetical protein